MTEASSQPLLPVSLGKDGTDGLFIVWNDGHRSHYTWKHLRERCPCASCREAPNQPKELFPILKPSELVPKPPLAPLQFVPMGHYAYKIAWNDGHDTGLYTLENLRSLCQCAECQSGREQ